jgi:hypothetical protein
MEDNNESKDKIALLKEKIMGQVKQIDHKNLIAVLAVLVVVFAGSTIYFATAKKNSQSATPDTQTTEWERG